MIRLIILLLSVAFYLPLFSQSKIEYYLLADSILNTDNQEAIQDSIFQSLHNMQEYNDLLPPEITDSLDRNNNWEKDIDYLSKMLMKTHYDPFCRLRKSDWDETVQKLKNGIPFLNNDQILVRMHQFVARIGDGHTSVYSYKSNLSEKVLPVLTQVFCDGCYVIGATQDYSELLGAKVIEINGLAFDQVYDTVKSVISVDNEMGYKNMFPWCFFRMSLMYGLGLSRSKDSLEITYLLDGVKSYKMIQSVKPGELGELIRYHAHFNKSYPLFLENYHKGKKQNYWYKYIPENKILYLQINRVISNKEYPIAEFCDSIYSVADTLDLSAFVLDVRNNSGGNSELNKYLRGVNGCILSVIRSFSIKFG